MAINPGLATNASFLAQKAQEADVLGNILTGVKEQLQVNKEEKKEAEKQEKQRNKDALDYWGEVNKNIDNPVQAYDAFKAQYPDMDSASMRASVAKSQKEYEAEQKIAAEDRELKRKVSQSTIDNQASLIESRKNEGNKTKKTKMTFDEATNAYDDGDITLKEFARLYPNKASVKGLVEKEGQTQEVMALLNDVKDKGEADKRIKESYEIGKDLSLEDIVGSDSRISDFYSNLPESPKSDLMGKVMEVHYGGIPYMIEGVVEAAGKLWGITKKHSDGNHEVIPVE